jgi:hypothetical protein
MINSGQYRVFLMRSFILMHRPVFIHFLISNIFFQVFARVNIFLIFPGKNFFKKVFFSRILKEHLLIYIQRMKK